MQRVNPFPASFGPYRLLFATLTAAFVLASTTRCTDFGQRQDITLDATQLRRCTIPSDFLGLSLEMSSIMAANNNGVAWLSGNPTAYSAMVQKIGVSNIRIGGNSSERQPYASSQDGANVDAFTPTSSAPNSSGPCRSNSSTTRARACPTCGLFTTIST